MKTTLLVSAELFLRQQDLLRVTSSRKEDEDAEITLTVVDSSYREQPKAACVLLTLEELCVLREKIEMVIQHG